LFGFLSVIKLNYDPSSEAEVNNFELYIIAHIPG